MKTIKIIGTILVLTPPVILSIIFTPIADSVYGPIGGFLFATFPLLYLLFCIKMVYHVMSLKIMSFFVKLEPDTIDREGRKHFKSWKENVPEGINKHF